MTAIENQANISKMNELESWKKKNGENVKKARLCVRCFEKIKAFLKDSPCCSQIRV